MNVFLSNTSSLRKKFPLRALLGLLLVLLSIFSFGCKKEIDYFDYVSELRSNVFLAESDGFSLRVYAVKKETPYIGDGIKQETSDRVEAYLVAPEADKSCRFTFTVGDRDYGGEMSFDNVKCEYFYSCTLDVSALSSLPCKIEYEGTEIVLDARSVLTQATLSPKAVLQKLQTEEAELFNSLTDKYGFAGEIYLRLIFEESPFYYVGVIDRTGKINAFLLNAETGKVLAKRES